MNRSRFLPSRGLRRSLRRICAVVTLLLACGGSPFPAEEPPDLSVNDELEWMKSLALEGRISYGRGDPLLPRLLSETFPDGRTWFARIADDLATHGDWAMLDAAVGVCLAEADHLKQLALRAAGTPDEGRYNAIRKAYLEAAGRLLAAYRNRADEAFDDHAGGLLGLTGIPDWTVPLLTPGGIELREIAGAGRFNVATRDFSGRLSGLLRIPGLDTTLAVPNLSFDARGNVDLTAYGRTRFPPNDPGGVTLTIPPRNPLAVHLADDGDFRVAGSAVLGLPGGNEILAQFDIDDPDYAFGLAFSGVATLDLANEITLVRPTFDFDPANPPALAVLDGMARFFGSLGRGMESFLAEAPDLPSLDEFDVGTPPDFKAPQTDIPFDVFDAWIVAVGNQHVRPALNGPVTGTVGLLREALAGLRTHLEAARQEVEPGLTQLQRLSRVVEMNGKLRKVLEDAAARAALGEDSEAVFEEAGALADEALRVAVDHLEAVPADADFKTGLAAVRLAIKADANATSLGLGDTGLVIDTVLAKLDQWHASMLDREGFHADGTVADAARVAALTPVDLRTLAIATLEVERHRQTLGADSEPFAPATGRILRLEFERVRDGYQAAVAAGDDEARVRYAAKLPDYATLTAAGVLEATDEEQELMLRAYFDTWTALKNQDGGTPRDYLTAQKRLQAAHQTAETERATAIRRKEELFGSAGGMPDVADRIDLSLYQYTFWQRIGFGIRALRDAGILDAVLEGRLQADLPTLLGFYRQSLEAKFADETLVQQNLEDAYGALLGLIDMIALVEDFLPGDAQLLGEFKQTWQALHLRWVAVAEARKAHWLLSSYARELVAAAGRYGDGVGSALETAFAKAGTEATAGLARVVDGLAAAFATIDRETLRFKLPGDLEVRRLFGELAFNRVSGDWLAGFGGLLVFPDINAEFEVGAARLASNGDFSLSLRTRGPVPFGLEDSMSLNLASAFALTGNLLAPSIDAATASGTLTQTITGQAPNLYDVSLAYEFLDPGHRMQVETSFQGARELFTKEIVLFSGGFGFNLETDGGGVPQQGGLESDFSAGILLRPEARSKPVGELTPDDFLLAFSGAGALGFSRTEQRVSVSLNRGELTLPPDIFSDETGTLPAKVLLNGPVCLAISLATGEVSFCEVNGAPVRLGFQNILLRIPGLEGAELAIPTATLRLSGSELPILENLNATLTLTLPGANPADPEQNRSVAVAIAGQDWRIDGLPAAASLNLVNPLRVVELDGFSLDLVPGSEAQVGDCPPGLAFRRDPVTGVTTLSLAGGMRASLDPSLLWDAGANTVLDAEAVGCFAWQIGALPTFSLGSLSFSGRARLGGPDGIGIIGLNEGGVATITFVGVGNLFHQTPATPFEIKLDGALDVAGFVRFGLVDTKFVWDGSSLLPRFDPGGAQTELGDKSLDLVENVLPLYLTKARVELKDRGRPLIPPSGQAGLLDPDNIRVIVSGRANLPAGAAAIESGVPGLAGQVDDLEISLRREGEGFVPDFNIAGLGLQISNLDIPPLGGLTGGIYVGNLDALDATPPRPQDIYFAGKVGAKIEDVGAEVMLALTPTEIIGACFSLNAGPAGIPLDGGAIGGLLLTGGKGGINFKNQFADPCKFESYINADTDLPAAGSPERPGNPPEIAYPAVPDAAEGFDCLEGPFPPPTINPLCEPHPSIAGRFVYKGTILTEAQLNGLGITREAVPGSIGAAIDWATGLLGGRVTAMAADVKAAVPAPVAPEVREQFNSIVDGLANSFDDTARITLRRGFEFALQQNPDSQFYDLLVEAGAAGIPSFDVTLKVAGTFSHAAVSTVLSGTGAVTLSSTGTAVLEGNINLVGIPVGTGTFAFSLTDSNGDLNPSFGGVAKAEIGPLEFGNMSMALSCDGCFAAVVDSFTEFLATNANSLGAGAREFLYALMDRTIPLAAPRERGIDIALHFYELSNGQKVAYVGSLFNIFQLVVNGDPLPVNVTAEVLTGFLTAFRTFVVDVATQVNPLICFSGQVGPKLFGFPLTGGADSIAGAHLLYGRRTDPITLEDYQELTASVEFSPTYLMMYPIMAAYQCPVVPAIDTAEIGFSLRVPALTEETAELALANPAGYLENQLTSLVEDGVISFGYEVSPLGLTLGNGQGRIIMPRIDAHPARPGVNWQLPTGAGVPTRTELILAALTKGQMKSPFWRGQTGQLDDLFTMPPNTDDETGYNPTNASCDDLTDAVAVRLQQEDPGLATLAGLDFTRDFFPHGGIMFGGDLGLPNVIAQLPPPQLFDLLKIPTNLDEAGAWLGNASFVIDNYLADTTCIGQLAGYLPAPNPLFPPGTDWSKLSLADFLRATREVDPAAVIGRSLPSSVYAFDQILFAGWFEVPLLGLPVARGSMEYDATGKVFTATAEVPAGTWLHELVQGSVRYEFRAPRYLEAATVDDIPNGGTDSRFDSLLASVEAMDAAGLLANGGAFAQDVVDTVIDTLPRASLTAEANLQLPPELGRVFNVNAATGLEVFAFSAFFEPEFEPDNESPYAQARRRGGIGLRGDFQLGYFPATGTPIAITIPDASFAITPGANLAAFPALTGQLAVGEFSLPGLPRFTDGLLAFNSAPDDGAHYLSVAGHLQPIVFTLQPGGAELLALRGSGPDGKLGGTLEILKDEANPPANANVRLTLEPLAATMQSLGADVAIAVELDPVTLDNSSTQPWSGSLRITSASDPNAPPTFSLRDPFSPAGSPALLTFKPNSVVSGSISGVGQQSFELQLAIPNGFDATFFPDPDSTTKSRTKTTVHIGGDGHATLAVDSKGRFFVDFGSQNNVGLPGVLTASGHLVFGYNPAGTAPRLAIEPTGPITFGSADLNQTIVRQCTVRNTGNAAAQVGLRVSYPADYSLSVDGFSLAPGATRTVDLTFHPSRTGARDATLTVESDSDFTPVLTRDLTGAGVVVPRYVQSRDQIVFPTTAVGSVSKGSVTIGNAGSLALPIANVSSSDPGVFPASPSGGFTLQPGEERLIVVSFIPSAKQPYNATLEITGGPKIGNHSVTLAGSGGEPQWATVLDSSLTGSTATLRDIKVLADGMGWAVGDDGAFYETRDSGASWTPRRIAGASLRDIHIQVDIGAGLIAAYHFEDPPGALHYRDDGPGGHHGRTPSVGNQPRGGHDYGKIGAGLYFDNPAGSADNATSDYVELGTFDLATSFAISLWVNPVDTRDGQCFVAKQTDSAANQFLFGFFSGGYWVFTPMGTLTAGGKQSGWQHLVVNGSYEAPKDATTITIFRQGVALGSKTFAGSLGGFGGGKSWVLGQRWDAQRVSDVLNGSLDELMFFNRTLSAAEMSALARGEGGHKILIAGRYGTLLQSDTRGRAWHQVFDQNVNGWRARLGTLNDYDWNGVTTSPGDGRTVVAGGKRAPLLITRSPLVMVEDLHDPNPAIANDEQFDEVAFYRNPADPPLTSEVANAVISQPNGRHFAFTSLGRAFTDSSGLGTTWPRHGTLDLDGGELHSAVSYQPFPGSSPTPSAYLAVGDQGTIIFSEGNAPPALVDHRLTTASLKAIATTGLLPVLDDAPPFHVVGADGTYLIGQNLGANRGDWMLVGNGLVGTNHGVEVRASKDTVGHTVWVAGEQNRIQRFHSVRLPNSPTLTFHPGQLDYGMIPLGHSRTLPLRLQNRGKSRFSISSLTVSGSGFSLAQSAVSALAPGDSATLQLRYKPAAASDLDLGQLVIAVSDRTFSVPLEGRCQNAEWVPGVLRSAGTAFDGSVTDLAYAGEFVRESVVYAITASPDRDRVFRSIDSGWSWTEITPPNMKDEFYRFEGLDALQSSLVGADVVALAGALHSGAGLVDGRILLSFNGGGTWLDRSPKDPVILPFSDVAIYPDAANTDVMVCSSRGSGADVWQTVNATPTSASWTRKASTPGSSFTGGRVAIFPILNTTPRENGAAVAASSGNLVFARGFNNEWSGSPSQGLPVLTSASVTGLHFGFSTSPFFRLNHAWMVGHGGQFWRWAPLDPTDVSPFQADTRWFPASNQQVFGTINLEAVAAFDNHPVGYIVGGSRIFRTGDHGHGWDLDYDAGPGGALKSAAIYPGRARAWAGGSLAGRATVWRQQAPAAADRPLLAANDIEFFAPVEVGQSSPQLGVDLPNIGSAPLAIHHVRLESDDPITRFRIVGTPPSSVAPGAPVELPVVFDALPDPVDLEALRPAAFLRFEDEWDAATFADHSGYRRNANTPTNPAKRPAIDQDVEAGRRDRCLRFDGDDYAEFPGPADLGSSFSVAFWVNPEQLNQDQNFIGKYKLDGSDEFVVGLYNNRYQVRLGGSAWGEGVPTTGWQHIVVTAGTSITGTTKVVHCWRDGEILWSEDFLPNVWSALGRPWVLGGDWDGSAMTDNLRGCLDDVALFDRVLTPAEIRMLASKSPACGEHRARLLIHSDSEAGERVVELRAEVVETSDLLVIDSVPSGRTISVDGVDRVTPFAATIRANAANDTEWVEGSLHSVTVPGQFTVEDSVHNQLDYRFNGWNAGSGLTRTIVAGPGTPDLKASYVVTAVTAPALAPPVDPPRAPDNAPPPFGFDTALAGTPAGPFLRITNGNLTVGGLAGGAFGINGELFVSLTKLHAALHTDALNVPASADAGTRFLELGSSEWLLDLEADPEGGGVLRLEASPPSVKVLGKHELAPDGQFSLEMDTAQEDRFEVAFQLRDDYRPIPDFLEFKKGMVRAKVQLDPNGIHPPAFVYRFEGGMRLLRLPGGFPQAWAVDTTNLFEVNTTTFTRSLSSILGQQGPVTLVNHAPWFMSGDLTLSRVAGGDIVLTADIPDFRFHGSQVAELAGSISTGSELNLSGSASTVAMNLISGGRFKLENPGGGNVTFKTAIRTLPEPLFRLEVPALTLKCTGVTGFPDAGLALPGISFDTSGAFDTGRLALPTFAFDNVAISRPADGQIANNYIQLKRDSAGKITFDTRAQLKFLDIDGCTPDQFSLTIDGTKVDASYRGYFCVLPEPVALGYTPGLSCPLSGSAFGFFIHFGSPSCTGISQSGVCILGNCP